jgi:hypothetical protein
MENDDRKDGKDDRKVRELLSAAHREGRLSTASLTALDVPDLGARVSAGLGVAIDDVAASEVILVTMMPDDSSSIRAAGNAAAVRDGHNQVLDALAGCAQARDIFCHTRLLNGAVLSPYAAVERVPRLDDQNYDPSLGTPLYDQTVVVLGTVLAKAQEFEQNGVPVRTVTLILTDGADQHSTRAGPREVRALVEDMLAAETHVVAAIGIDDGATDFRRVFSDMGVPDRWILTPAATPAEIRAAFQVFSQSAVRVSQAAAFSKTALGGFLN